MSSNREWKWINAITREEEEVDIWWTVLDKVRVIFQPHIQ